MAVPVLFYRGPKSSYDVSQHGNGIYFCTDTYEYLWIIIHMGEVRYKMLH